MKRKAVFIVTGPFSIDNAKMYIAATLIMFHIVPLLLFFGGEVGRQLLLTTFMFMLIHCLYSALICSML